MNIALSKNDLSGKTGFDFGFQYEESNLVSCIFYAENGVLVKAGDMGSVPANILGKLPPHPIDPSYIDSTTFKGPRLAGVLKIPVMEDFFEIVIRLRALGVTDKQIKEGFAMHDPASYPAIKATVV